jgi:S-adenosyl-L-methionine hydrolase (adenosine-forming)
VNNPIITLATDFGYKDPLSGVMKGVILRINPAVNIVDLTHGIRNYDVRQAALTIGSSYSQFPTGTIHVVVTDPGVGSSRRPIMVTTENYYFIGPDNGVFSLIYESEHCEVIHLTADHYFLRKISSTFHGRDVFAPVAAWLSKGIGVSKFGETITDFVRFRLPEPSRPTRTTMEGEVILIDHFGNAVTNISVSDIDNLRNESKGRLRIIVKGTEAPLKEYYSQAGDKGLYSVIGSMDYLEFFVDRGNASSDFNIKVGDNVGIVVVTEK